MDPARPHTTGWDQAGRALRSHWLFAGLVVALVAVHAIPLPELVGGGAATFVRRNSETMVMLLVPWYWLLFAGRRGLDGRGALPVPERVVGQVLWLSGWFAMALFLQSISLGQLSVSLDQRVVTLGEGCQTVAFVSLYLGITRRLLPGPWRAGAPVTPVGRRALLGLAALAIVVWAYVPLLGIELPTAVVDFVRLNVEFVAAAFLMVLALDVVLGVRGGRATLVKGAWYAFLVGLPVATQLGLLGGVLGAGMVDWIGRATEAFLATLAITIWFDVVVVRRAGEADASAVVASPSVS